MFLSTQSAHLCLICECTSVCECILSKYICIWDAHISICVAAGLRVSVCVYLFRCVGVLSDQGSVKPSGAQHPHTALEQEQWPLQNKCKQLRATSISIRQTDSSCEQGLWLIASYQINWACAASREDNAARRLTLYLYFLVFYALFSRAAWLRLKYVLYFP